MPTPPLEFALLSYYSQPVIKIRPVEADKILPANNPKLADQKLGAAVLQEIQILRFLGKPRGSGRAITATARKLAVIIWHMLTNDGIFETEKMVDKKLVKKDESMSRAFGAVNETLIERQEKPAVARAKKKAVKKPTLPVGTMNKRKVG